MQSLDTYVEQIAYFQAISCSSWLADLLHGSVKRLPLEKINQKTHYYAYAYTNHLFFLLIPIFCMYVYGNDFSTNFNSYPKFVYFFTQKSQHSDYL